HGISTGALFFLAGMLYERRHSRLIEAFGGIARVVPLLAAVLTIVSLSSIGLPATNGFVGEFLVLLGTFQTYPLPAITATAGLLVIAWRHRTPADLRVAGWVTLAGLAAAGAAAWWLWWHTARAIGAPAMIAVDDFRFVADGLLLGTAGLTVLVSFDYLERERLL